MHTFCQSPKEMILIKSLTDAVVDKGVALPRIKAVHMFLVLDLNYTEIFHYTN